jgi:hypothetical protein
MCNLLEVHKMFANTGKLYGGSIEKLWYEELGGSIYSEFDVKKRTREGEREVSKREEGGYGLQGDARDERDETRTA